mmetsp:Transcript_42282/g.100826  ORF Transcript_42282/g.100826 Transcript_42282/m.100826 type:complete len:355 (+) Transcript_42282:408-1472(+)
MLAVGIERLGLAHDLSSLHAGLLDRLARCSLEGLSILLGCWQLHFHFAICDTGVESGEVQVWTGDAASRSQVIDCLVHWISHCDCATGWLTHQAARDHSHLLARAQVLGGEPLLRLILTVRQVEDRHLSVTVFHCETSNLREVSNLPGRVPLPAFLRLLLGKSSCTLDVWQVVGGWMALLPHVDVLQLLRVLGLIGVHKLLEFLLQVFVVDNLLPLALVCLHIALHQRLQVRADAQAVINDDLLQVLDSTRKLFEPWCCALQVLRCAAIEHEEAVDVLQACLLIDRRSEELCVARLGSAIAAEIKVVARVRGDAAYILALSLSTFSQAARHSHLDLVRCTQALVAVLQGASHAD